MRSIVILFALVAGLVAEDRAPIRVTCRPVFVPNVGLPVESTPHCVTIDGIDWDIDKLRAEYRTRWTWQGNTEQALRSHLATEHRIEGIERLSFSDIQKVHAVIHEREQKALHARSQVIRASPAPRASMCPGGVCPAPSRSRGLFFKWR